MGVVTDFSKKNENIENNSKNTQLENNSTHAPPQTEWEMI
jgi:hypothetical protein